MNGKGVTNISLHLTINSSLLGSWMFPVMKLLPPWFRLELVLVCGSLSLSISAKVAVFSLIFTLSLTPLLFLKNSSQVFQYSNRKPYLLILSNSFLSWFIFTLSYLTIPSYFFKSSIRTALPSASELFLLFSMANWSDFLSWFSNFPWNVTVSEGEISWIALIA